jgi:hypothetical protein
MHAMPRAAVASIAPASATESMHASAVHQQCRPNAAPTKSSFLSAVMALWHYCKGRACATTALHHCLCRPCRQSTSHHCIASLPLSPLPSVHVPPLHCITASVAPAVSPRATTALHHCPCRPCRQSTCPHCIASLPLSPLPSVHVPPLHCINAPVAPAISPRATTALHHCPCRPCHQSTCHHCIASLPLPSGDVPPLHRTAAPAITPCAITACQSVRHAHMVQAALCRCSEHQGQCLLHVLLGKHLVSRPPHSTHVCCSQRMQGGGRRPTSTAERRQAAAEALH